MSRKKLALPLSFLVFVFVMPFIIKDVNAAQFYPSETTKYGGVETFHVTFLNGTDLGLVDRISIWEVNVFNTLVRYFSAPKGINLFPVLHAQYPSAAIGEKYTGYGRMNITYGPSAGQWLTMNLTPCFELENGTILTSLASLGITSSNFTPLGLELSVASTILFPPGRQMQVNMTNFTERYRDSPVDPWTYSASSYHVNESQCIVGTYYNWNGTATLSMTVARNATDIVMLHENTTTHGNQYSKFSTYTADGEIKTVVEEYKYNSSGDGLGLGIASLRSTFDYTGYIPDYIPFASFTANSTYILPNELIQFTFTGRGGNSPYTFQWNFGDGTPNSTLRNPTHEFTTTGNFSVRLTVRDADGDIDTQVMQVIVHQASIWGWEHDYIVILVIIGIAAAIVAYSAYNRPRKRARVKSKYLPPAPVGHEPEPSSFIASMPGINAPETEYTIFSKDILDAIDKLGLSADQMEDLLALLSQVDSENRREYLDNLFNEKPDFDGNF